MLLFTFTKCDHNGCTVSSTVAGHHTDVVFLVVEHWELDGCVDGGEEES